MAIIHLHSYALRHQFLLTAKTHLQFCKRYLEVHYNGHNRFSLMKMTDYYNFCDFNCNSLNEGKIKQYVDLMKKNYISYWNQTLQHSQKT